MGLLDGMFSDDPRQQAMLTMAMGLLGSGGKSFGSALGNAGLLGQQAYSAGVQRQAKLAEEKQQQAMREMQMEQLKRTAEDQRFAAEIAPQFFSSGSAPADGMGPSMPAKSDFTGYGQALMARNPTLGMPWIQAGQKDNTPLNVKDGESLVDRHNFKTLYSAPKPQWVPVSPEEARSRGLPNNGQGFQRNSVTNEIKAIGSAPPTTNVTVTADKSYTSALSDGLAKQDLAIIDAARGAPKRLETARQVKSIIDKGGLITGVGADQRVSFEKALAQAGLVGNDRVANTEQLASTLATQTLDAIKTSGLGSGQGFTDKDRQFLQDAAAGRIQLEPQTIRRIAVLNELSAAQHIAAGNKVISRIRKTKGFENFTLDDIETPSPAPAQTSPNSGGLTAEEKKELESLRKRLNRGV